MGIVSYRHYRYLLNDPADSSGTSETSADLASRTEQAEKSLDTPELHLPLDRPGPYAQLNVPIQQEGAPQFRTPWPHPVSPPIVDDTSKPIMVRGVLVIMNRHMMLCNDLPLT
jgi:hypothetical protein